MAGSRLSVPCGAVKKKKVLGRGNGTGKGRKCGRGDKGQNARSGGGVRLGFEGGQMPLYRRIARRGFSNARFKKEYFVVNLRDLEQKFEKGETVNREVLYERSLISKKNVKVKILGAGILTKSLTVAVDKVSESAKKKITEAGGAVALATKAALSEPSTTEKRTEVEKNGE